MSPRPHDGPAEEGLSSAFLRIIRDPEQVEALRTLLSGFCHRCRNSLNGIKMGLYLFRREAKDAIPDSWGDLESIYHELELLFDHLQAIYRPMTVTRIRSHVDDLIEQHAQKWKSWFETRGGAIRLAPPKGKILADFDPVQLGAGLDAVASWRAATASSNLQTRIAWTVVEGSIVVRWDEILTDAPSMPRDLDGHGAGRNGHPSSPLVDALALPRLARIIGEHGGQLDHSVDPGLTVRICWPQFDRTERCDEA